MKTELASLLRSCSESIRSAGEAAQAFEKEAASTARPGALAAGRGAGSLAVRARKALRAQEERILSEARGRAQEAAGASAAELPGRDEGPDELRERLRGSLERQLSALRSLLDEARQALEQRSAWLERLEVLRKMKKEES